MVVQMGKGRGDQAMPNGQEGTALLSRNVSFDGTLVGSGRGLIRLEGHFKGKIRHEGQLIIAETAVVNATVEGQEVIVMGLVEGDITAARRLDLKPTARVVGNLKARRLTVEDGASLIGSCEVAVAADDDPPPEVDAPTGIA